MIIRTPKRSNFVTCDKVFVEDGRLSWRAKGIMLYLLSKPNDWQVIESDIIKHGREGRDAVRAALKELQSLGYLRKGQARREGNRYGPAEYDLIERPEGVLAERGRGELVYHSLVVSDFPSTDFQATEGSKQRRGLSLVDGDTDTCGEARAKEAGNG